MFEQQKITEQNFGKSRIVAVSLNSGKCVNTLWYNLILGPGKTMWTVDWPAPVPHKTNANGLRGEKLTARKHKQISKILRDNYNSLFQFNFIDYVIYIKYTFSKTIKSRSDVLLLLGVRELKKLFSVLQLSIDRVGERTYSHEDIGYVAERVSC